MSIARPPHEKWNRELVYVLVVAAVALPSASGLWFAASREYTASLPLAQAVVFILKALGVLGCLFPFLALGDLWVERRKLWREEREQATRAYDARRPLREAVRLFAHQQSEYLKLVRKSAEDQASWADSADAFTEIINDWRETKLRFDELRKSDDYEAVLADLGPAFLVELERVWAAREDLIGYARFESDRVKRRAQDGDEEIRWQDEARRIREEVKRRASGPPQDGRER